MKDLSNLPDGCSNNDIERAAGAYDEPGWHWELDEDGSRIKVYDDDQIRAPKDEE